MEFLQAIDYDFPEWATDFLARMEEALGDAYTEPAADVRGYVASVKGRRSPPASAFSRTSSAAAVVRIR